MASCRASLLVATALLLAVCSSQASKIPNPSETAPDTSLYGHRLLLDNTSTAILSFNTSSKLKSGSWVQVSWSGVAVPDAKDMVALYTSPLNQAHAPLKMSWTKVVAARTYMNGSGTANFWLPNWREDIIAVYIQKSFGSAASTVYSAASAPATFSANQPTKGRLGLTANVGEISITWQTKDMNNPMVRYGLSKKALHSISTASTNTYTAMDLCAAPANSTGFFPPGSIHTAVMTVHHSTTYFYQFGDMEEGFSPIYTFTTAPKIGTGTLNILGVADLGHWAPDAAMEFNGYATDENLRGLSYLEPNTTYSNIFNAFINTINEVSPQPMSYFTMKGLSDHAKDPHTKYNLVMLNGDVSYARGQLAQWDTFLTQVEGFTTLVPMITSPGNHERDTPFTGDRYNNNAEDSGGECGVVYERLLPLPNQVVGNQWYSFNMGVAHFLQISTEQDFSPGSLQYQFIVADLAAVNRKITPWVFVGYHRPMYTDEAIRGGVTSPQYVAKDLQDALEPVFFDAQVDAIFNGHIHTYTRSCPVYNGTCLPNNADGTTSGPTHVVMGHGGFEADGFYTLARPAWQSKMVRSYGYTTMKISRTRFALTMIDSLNGTVMDTLNLTKPSGWKPNRAAAMSLRMATPQDPLSFPPLINGTVLGYMFSYFGKSLSPDANNSAYISATFAPSSDPASVSAILAPNSGYGSPTDPTLMLTHLRLWKLFTGILGLMRRTLDAQLATSTNPMDFAANATMEYVWGTLNGRLLPAEIAMPLP
ncbi:MAG: hypothetical protein WDW38_006775 [Sanguina aurantia]